MPEYCTCGAQLPPDALFCHKCGKPQRDLPTPVEPEPQPEIVAPPIPAALPPDPLPMNFRNPRAVRIALLVSVAATIFGFLPFFNWLTGGFVAVLFYRRNSQATLNVGAGVRLGWITGVMMFFWSALLAIPNAVSGDLAKMLRERMTEFAANDPSVNQMIDFFQSAPGIFTLFAVSFISIIGLSMAGGALSAKLLRRD